MTRSFEWDSGKSRSNLEKHGIDFETATTLWNDPSALELQALYKDEFRYSVIGKILGTHYTAIITYRHNTIRIISVRISRRVERIEYDSQD